MNQGYNAHREARKKALAAAKEKLNKRRKQREELKQLKENQKQEIGSGSSQNDYGRGLIDRTSKFVKELNDETQNSKRLEESISTSSGNGSGVDVPGPRVALSIVNEVNSVDFNKRELVEYGKEIQTDAFEIAQFADLISDETETMSEKHISEIMSCFHDSGIKPWPPVKKAVNETRDGDGSGSGSGSGGSDDVAGGVGDISMKQESNDASGGNDKMGSGSDENKTDDLKLDEESFVMAEEKAIELMNEKGFSHSFGIKSYLLENLISSNEEHSIFYEVDAIDKDNENEAQSERLILKRKLSLNSMKGRSITNLHVSPTNPNYLLASHSSLGLLNGYFLDSSKAEENLSSLAFDDNFDGTEGIINVWNIEDNDSESPIYELICQSMVTTAKFHPTNPNLVIAATVSGQVLGWDMRAKKTPIMRTQFSSGHNAPVFSMGFLSKGSDDQQKNTGSETKEDSLNKQAKHIITVSNDGRVCVWRDDFLVNPLSEFTLKLGSSSSNNNSNNSGDNSKTGMIGSSSSSSSSSNEELSTTCFSSLSKDGNVIVFGSDDGCLYKCNEMMSDSMMTGARSVVDSGKMGGSHSHSHGHGAVGGMGGNNGYDLMVDGSNNYINDESNKGSNKKFAHFGPITNVDFHPYFGRYSLQDDSPSLYLSSSFDWTVKLWHKKDKEPICTFGQMADYVYDAKWSPARPSVFVCGDGLGKLTMFDLLNDFDSPIAVLSTNEENSKKQCSITRVEWQKDGKCLFVGDSQGDVSVYDVSPSLYETSDADFSRFEEIIKKKI